MTDNEALETFRRLSAAQEQQTAEAQQVVLDVDVTAADLARSDGDAEKALQGALARRFPATVWRIVPPPLAGAFGQSVGHGVAVSTYLWLPTECWHWLRTWAKGETVLPASFGLKNPFGGSFVLPVAGKDA